MSLPDAEHHPPKLVMPKDHKQWNGRAGSDAVICHLFVWSVKCTANVSLVHHHCLNCETIEPSANVLSQRWYYIKTVQNIESRTYEGV